MSPRSPLAALHSPDRTISHLITCHYCDLPYIYGYSMEEAAAVAMDYINSEFFLAISCRRVSNTNLTQLWTTFPLKSNTSSSR